MTVRLAGGHTGTLGKRAAPRAGDLRLLKNFGLDRTGDFHGNHGDFRNSGCFHPAELAVLSGRHGAGDVGRGLDEQCCIHDDFLGCESNLKMPASPRRDVRIEPWHSTRTETKAARYFGTGFSRY